MPLVEHKGRNITWPVNVKDQQYFLLTNKHQHAELALIARIGKVPS